MGLNLRCAPLWCFCKNYKMFEVVPQVEEEKLVFKRHLWIHVFHMCFDSMERLVLL